MEDTKIAIAQINTSVGDIESNVDKIVEFVEKAKATGAELVVFPEMTIPGYPPRDLLLSPEFIEDCEKALARVREASNGIAVVVGSVDLPEDAEKPFNTAFVFNNGKLEYKYHKAHLPNYDVFDEKRYFNAGTDPGVFMLNGRKIGLNICEDIWIEGGPADIQAASGVDLIVNLSASPFYYGKTLVREKLITDHIARGNTPIIYVNQVGGQDDLIFDGESFAYNGKGQLLAQGRHFKEELIVFNINDQPITLRPDPKVEEVYEALKMGLRDFVDKTGKRMSQPFEKVVFGLSGGVDSALVAAIAADALGPDRVMAVLMPSEFSSTHSIIDSEKLVQNLGIDAITLPIGNMYNTTIETVSTSFSNKPFDLTEENIQARLRMVALYAVANKHGYMVLNTSNKSEAAVGYGTLYGDMAGDFGVISDVPKMLVYELCNYVNEKAMYERIPGNIITKEPSAELREGQLDRQSLPDYDKLDLIVNAYVEHLRSPAQIEAEHPELKELIKDVVRKVDAAEHKRRKAPPGTKITPLAFGTGRRMPITNGYAGR